MVLCVCTKSPSLSRNRATPLPIIPVVTYLLSFLGGNNFATCKAQLILLADFMMDLDRKSERRCEICRFLYYCLPYNLCSNNYRHHHYISLIKEFAVLLTYIYIYIASMFLILIFDLSKVFCFTHLFDVHLLIYKETI